MENALSQAEQYEACYAVARDMDGPLFIFQIRDQLTGEESNVTHVMAAIQHTENGMKLLMDEEIVNRLLEIQDAMPKSKDVYLEPMSQDNIYNILEQAEQELKEKIPTMKLAYRMPSYELVAGIVPELKQ